MRELKNNFKEQEKLRCAAEKRCQRLERELGEEKQKHARGINCKRQVKCFEVDNEEVEKLRRSLKHEMKCNEDQKSLIKLLETSISGGENDVSYPKVEACKLEIRYVFLFCKAF